MIKTICVCGAGTMGSGIAQVAARAGFTTIQFDVNSTILQKSRQAIQESLQYLCEKQKISSEEKAGTLERIHFTSDYSDCIADLVIEAIIEEPAAKTALFNQLAGINTTDTIFASNTSSLSITALQENLPDPGRFAGLHFFNPAPVMKLVEIIKGKWTTEHVIRELNQLCLQLGKTPVHCSDSPGFIVNRVARPYYLEAMHLLNENVAGMEAIDRIMEATGFKMGPFKLMDLIGIDINYHVSEIVYEALGKPSRLQPSVIQKEKLVTGKLGRKTGEGFYKYP
ncbi:MAG: 3-hydroxyacyl-CoA dehydrogenase NAD-binding domain-containing protein [Bacteroidota bacterium]